MDETRATSRRNFTKIKTAGVILLSLLGLAGGLWLINHYPDLWNLALTWVNTAKTWWLTTGWDQVKEPLLALAFLGVVILILSGK